MLSLDHPVKGDDDDNMMVMLMKGDMCGGIDADKRGSCTKDGITRHLSRLAGAHDDDDHAHDELVDMCKNHETVFYAIQGF